MSIKICTVYFEGKYSPDYVEKLYNGLKKYCTLPFEFICYSDNPNVKADKIIPLPKDSKIKRHWHKLSFFNPEFADQEEGDEIIGIIHVRDVLKALENDKKTSTLEMISRKPVFVSQEKMVSDLLKEMQGRQTHMAIVIDEFGGVEGCVTLDDLLEEIVGEIKDEKDTEQQIFQNDGSNAIITNGDIEIDTINEIFKTDLSAGDDYSQLNGLLHEQLHDIPKEGDKLEINSLRIIVEKVSKNKPERIKIEKIK